jgi:hypothetical protein
MSNLRTRIGTALAAAGLLVMMQAPIVPVAAAATAPTCADQLKVVKTEMTAAPAGAKHDEAKKHYKAAVTASKKSDDKTCLSELGLAQAALK